MALFYSASTGGFYDDRIHKKLPDDAVQISTKKHRALMAAQSSGKAIVADADGAPIAVAHKADSAAVLARLRRERDRRLAASDWSQLADAPLDAAQREEWRTYRQKLRDLPQQPPRSLSRVNWPATPGAADEFT